jgi:adenine phosphoribosyltransferase
MSASGFTGQAFRVDVAGREVSLPIFAIKPDFGIALMMVIDMGVGFGAHVGAALAARLWPRAPEIVVGTATLGIPVALEVSRALGIDDYVILQKSPKLHLADALRAELRSITSSGVQSLLLDQRAVAKLRGRRVALVDDVVATGGSVAAALALLRQAGADVVAVGVVLTEAADWRAALGADAELVVALGHIPQFRPGAAGWEPIAGTD